MRPQFRSGRQPVRQPTSITQAVVPEPGRLTHRRTTDAAATSTRAVRQQSWRQLSHDIHHEIGTIMMLASVLCRASDVGAASRERASRLLAEARWLDQLQRAYEDCCLCSDGGWSRRPSEPVRVDLVAGEVVASMRLSTSTRIAFSAVASWAAVDPLALWRVLRNLLGNAVRATGPEGTVDVRIAVLGRRAEVRIDDDGPGFGAGEPGLGSLGLSIVRDLVGRWGGRMTISDRVPRGCSVELTLPSAASPGRTGSPQ